MRTEPDRMRKRLSQEQVRLLFGNKSLRTLHHWINTKGFPAPVNILGKNYFDEIEIQAWMDRQIKAATPAKPPKGARA